MLNPRTLLPLLFLTAAVANAQTPSPNDQLTAAANEAATIRKTFDDELRVAKHDMPLVTAANEKYRQSFKVWFNRAKSLVLAHPAEPAALDVILAIAQFSTLDDRLLAIVRENHMDNPKVLELVHGMAQSPGTERKLAEGIAQNHPDRTVRGTASLTLARLDRVYLVDALGPKPVFEGRLGKPDQLRTRARSYLDRVIKDYADVPSKEGPPLGDLAKDELAGLDNVGKLEVGKPAIDITGEDLEGKPLTMTAKSGKVTLLVFWGAWCGPCMALVPHEAAIAAKYKDRPFTIYGVDGGDERDVARKTADDKGMTWPSFYGTRQRGGLAAVWNVDAWPAVYVINPEGIITYKGYGDDLEAAVEKAVLEAEKQQKH